jgi:hypothetical protein
LIALVGSKAVTRRPTNINLETALEDDSDDKEALPTPRAPTEILDIEPYQTPVALTPANRKNKARAMPEPEESSDVEMVTMEMLGKKKRKALTGTSVVVDNVDTVCTSSVD